MLSSWVFYAGLTIFFWGVWGIFGKLAAKQLTSWAVFATSFLPSIVLVSMSFLVPRLRPMWAWPASGFAVLAGLSGLLGTIMFFQVLGKSPVGPAVALTALYPAVSVILAVLFLKEQISLLHAIGIALALVAGYLLAK